MSLAARHLEEAGIATVVVGSARDVVERCGVPRFLFSDFPLGNPCGAPYDVPMQTAIAGMALELLASARFPRTTVQTPFHWPTEDWRANYMRFDDLAEEQLQTMGDERKARQAAGKSVMGGPGPAR